MLWFVSLYYLVFLPEAAGLAAGAALAAPFTFPLSCFGFFASRLPFRSPLDIVRLLSVAFEMRCGPMKTMASRLENNNALHA